MTTASAPAQPAGGVALGVVTFVLWGLYPFYFKAVAAVSPFEILAHRILWSFVLLAALIPLYGQGGALAAALRDPRRARGLVLTACLISANWLVYVVAVNGGNVLDASLGYFLGPLVSVALGVVVLGERLSRVQSAAVAIAAIAVLNLVVQQGVLPKAALFMGISFALYGLIRKRLGVPPIAGLFVECLLALPLALGILVWLGRSDGLAFLAGDRPTVALLLLGGVVTVVPMLLFNMTAQRVGLATIGVMQYIAPSLLFLESVLLFGEPLNAWRLVTFLLIWTALALYTGDGVLRARRASV